MARLTGIHAGNGLQYDGAIARQHFQLLSEYDIAKVFERIRYVLDVRLQRLCGSLHLLGGGRRLGGMLIARTVRRMRPAERVVCGAHQ